MADTLTRFLAGDKANAAFDTATVRGGVPNAIDVNIEPLTGKEGAGIATETDDGDGLLDVGDLVRMFEEAESSTYTARELSERDRDYYDNKQLTDEEQKALKERGQPPVIINRIKRKIDYLVGLEKSQRIQPKALPRTPQHEQDADGATQALRYVSESEDYANKRSGVWRNMLIEGSGGIGVAVEQDARGEMCVTLRYFSWDRIFHDPHSSRPDFSDAGYLGSVLWMDYADAIKQYPGPEALDALDNTLSTAPSETYDDKPKWSMWADKKRKRVRIVQIWIKKGETWYFAEYTKGGILKAGPSPYVNDKGESDCELFFQSAYVDRDNNRYGVVREMISPQDEVNKRRSKALHLLNTAQVIVEEDTIPSEAFGGLEGLRKQAARPDGTIVLPPGGLSNNKFKFETRTDLATAQFQLLQESKNEIDLMGPNATMLGDKAQGSAAASGKAIIASQQGGMIEMGDLLDHLRHLDKRVFRAMWSRIRQFWQGEKWVRVTDDERNVKWVGMNVDPAQMQMASPEDQQRIAGMVANVAELDCDIIIDEAPDSVTPALEQWQSLVELKKVDAGGELPFRMLIEAAPNLKNKDRILEMMDGKGQPDPMQQAAQQLQMQGVQAKVRETEESANLKHAQAQKTMIEAQLAPAEFQQDQANEQHARAERFATKVADMHERGTDRETQQQESAAERQARMRSEQMRAQQRQPQPA